MNHLLVLVFIKRKKASWLRKVLMDAGFILLRKSDESDHFNNPHEC